MTYYLSVYMQAPDISALAVMRHDHCAALWRRTGDTVTLQRYWEFERVTGVKHHRVPLRFEEDARAFLDSLLAEEGLSLGEMSAVWGTPGLLTDNAFKRRQVPAGHAAHSVAHLFSAIGMDWRALRTETILGLALDAGPDLQLDEVAPEVIYSGCVVADGEITIVPIESPGLIWALARSRFKREEGTLMALCSATTCAVDFDVETFVADLPFWAPSDVLSSAHLTLEAAVSAVEEELATPAGRVRSRYDERFDLSDNTQSAVMKLLERASWVIVDRNVERIKDEFALNPAETHLALCGGYALNCPNNSRMLDKYGFAGLMTPPCPNDGGQALGLGLMALHDRGATRRCDFRLGHAFHGREVTDLQAALQRFAPAIEGAGAWTFDTIVDDLERGPVAWVQGAAEIGPRALGHRSILGDPRDERTKHVLNQIKHRQWWRPVAPVIMEDRLATWFATGRRRSPFMLEVFAANAGVRDRVPAVLHLDGTARIQTVSAADDDLLYLLVEAFQERTGVPILANTSLNDRGEPLVDSAMEALNFCVRKGLRVAYINGVRIGLRPDAAAIIPLTGPHPRRSAPFERDAARWAALWREWTDLGLSQEAMFVYAHNPRLRNGVDPRSAGGARVLRMATSAFLGKTSGLERRFVEAVTRAIGPESDVLSADASGDFMAIG